MKKPSVYYWIFALSGLSGLIYESIWTHYLKLFLGHAAFAQTLVLAIFMGGMALGAYLCSRYSYKWKNLLLGYAVVEGIIGICALAYHPLFNAGINFSYATVLPALNSPVAITAYKWIISTLSILPQSILLGMTFPLMSGAFLRRWPDSSGSSVAMLYFANSIGAVCGVLASGFVFIAFFGFPGTIGIAGLLNIIIAIAVYLVSRAQPEPEPVTIAARNVDNESTAGSGILSQYRLLIAVSLITGAASFMYEIGWIRMLALVLGSSTHAFELMLGSFLLGLSTGGLWIKKRIDTLENPVRTLAIIQIVMGLAALATLPLYNGTFPIMQWLIKNLPKTDAGYMLFNIGSYGIASVIMLPATFCAGMTLPLITNILFRSGHGEKSIGAVYAANTIGAIVGIFGAVHLIMPSIGLKGILVTGASLDLLLAITLTASAADSATRRLTARLAVICIASVGLIITTVNLDAYKMATGIYRNGTEFMNSKNTRLLFHKDGKTATITVASSQKGYANIRTNGKSDSEISLYNAIPPSDDEYTTILSGALPLVFKPAAESVAIIGLGTGLTTQTVLSNPNVKRVDTIEIEKAVVEGARAAFAERTPLVYNDPRSTILIDDAKSLFSSQKNRYDIIISEPSNPWVSGVAALFSDEFYRHVKRYLKDDGIFVQWLQLYETDMDLAASIFKALSMNFSDYRVYQTVYTDIMIVATKSGTLGTIDPESFKISDFAALLKRIHVKGPQDIRIREIGDKKFLLPYFNTYKIKANSDYFPVVDQKAVKARFMNSDASDLMKLALGTIPYLHLLSENTVKPSLSTVSVAKATDTTILARRGASMREYLLTGNFPADADSNEMIVSPIVRKTATDLRKMASECSRFPETYRKELLSTASAVMLPYLTYDELEPVWKAVESPSCATVMTSTEKQYLELFKAISKRQFKPVSLLAGELLTTDRQLPAHTKQYVTGIGMLAAIADGNRTEALKLYRQTFGSKKSPDIFFQLLYANASQQTE